MGADHAVAPAPWGALIAAYMILAGVASGTTLWGWWSRPREQDAADALEQIAGLVALAALAACGLILVVDLGRPGRFFLMLTELSNLGSLMSLGAKLIALEAAALALHLFLIHRRRQARAIGDAAEPTGATRALYRAAPALVGIASLGVAVYPAFLLSQTWASPLAATPGAGLMFLTTALLMGAAALALIASAAPRIAAEAFRARVGRALLGLLLAQGLVLLLEGLALRGSHQPALVGALRALERGGASAIFWLVVVGIGLVVPLIGLGARARSRWVMAASAIAVLIGAGAARYLLFTVR